MKIAGAPSASVSAAPVSKGTVSDNCPDLDSIESVMPNPISQGASASFEFNGLSFDEDEKEFDEFLMDAATWL